MSFSAKVFREHSTKYYFAKRKFCSSFLFNEYAWPENSHFFTDQRLYFSDIDEILPKTRIRNRLRLG